MQSQKTQTINTLNVGMVSTFGVKCGIATYTKYLCEALAIQDVHIEVLAERPYPEFSQDKDFSSSIPYRLNWVRTDPYSDIIRDSKEFDILHIQHQLGLFPYEDTFAQLMNKAKKPIVLTLHDVMPLDDELKKYFQTLLKADQLIVHTQASFELLQKWNADMAKVSLIPHGTLLIDIPNKQQTRKELGFPEDAEIIMSWGFIYESKGILELVLTLAEILKTHPKAILIHAGGIHPLMANPTYLTQILDTAMNYGISPKQFRITEWIPEMYVPKLFAIADVIVLNYARNHACSSGAAHRAMAAHRPIVKTTDICLKDIPGYQVSRLSLLELYKGILTVLEDTGLQKKLVEAADKASQETSWEVVAKQHKNLYEKV